MFYDVANSTAREQRQAVYNQIFGEATTFLNDNSNGVVILDSTNSKFHFFWKKWTLPGRVSLGTLYKHILTCLVHSLPSLSMPLPHHIIHHHHICRYY